MSDGTMGTAIVLGGSRGIGLASAVALARDGFNVFFTYSANPHAAHSAHKAIAEQNPTIRVASCQADVRSVESVKAAFDQAEREIAGPLRCVLVSAGINKPPSAVHESDPAVFGELVNVNLIGAYNVLREAGRRIADGGSIITV